MGSQLKLKSQERTVDIPLLATTVLLVFLGLIIIYDASVVAAFRDFGDKFYYFKNQLIWASLGFAALGFLSFTDYHKLFKASALFMAVTIFLLIIVLIPGIGTKVYGARRWINIAGFSFQPSELAKITLIFYAANILAKLQKYQAKLSEVVLVLFLPIFLVTGLVLAQPDLGTASILVMVALAMYFIGGGAIWHLLAAVPVVVGAVVAAVLSQPYRIARLKSFLDPTHDPQGASYQIYQILIALSSGGLLGVGLGGSRAKFAFIPEVHSDAIFAVLVEELGFLGALVLISLFLILITRAIVITRQAYDYQGRILAAGITSLIATQSLFNLASNVALVPLVGIPLPFISYGGSSLFVTMAAVGILLNIKKQS